MAYPSSQIGLAATIRRAQTHAWLHDVAMERAIWPQNQKDLRVTSVLWDQENGRKSLLFRNIAQSPFFQEGVYRLWKETRCSGRWFALVFPQHAGFRRKGLGFVKIQCPQGACGSDTPQSRYFLSGKG